MKKFIYLSIAFVLLLTGCLFGNDSPEMAIANAGEKMDKLNNYKMDCDIEYVLGDEDYNYTVKMGMYSDVDNKNNTAKMSLTFEMEGMNFDSTMYVQYDGNKSTTYTMQEEEWYKTTQDDDYDDTLGFIENISETTKVESDNNDNKYKVVLSEEGVNKLLGDAFENEEIDFKPSDAEILIYITKDGYISKVILNMPIKMSSEGVEMQTTLKMSFTFSKFNTNGNVTIPNDVIDNAIDITEE